MEEDLPHPDPESQYSGTNAHLEMLKDMLMTYNMYDNKKVGMTPKTLSFLFSPWRRFPSSFCLFLSLALCEADSRLCPGNERPPQRNLRNPPRRLRRLLVFLRLHGPHGTLPFPLSTLPRNHPPPSILLI